MSHRGKIQRRTLLAGVAGSTLTWGLRACPSIAGPRARDPSAVEIRQRTLRFVESMRWAGEPFGRYRYSASTAKPTLYSSSYAAMTRHLYRDLDALSDAQRRQWIGYFRSHQDDDGLFRDPVIYGEGWYQGDPEWCGRRHLSCHVVTALRCLGAVADKPMRFLEPLLQPGALVHWLESRAWGDRPDFVGNEVLNVGTLMQYARDCQGDARCAPAVRTLLEWMNTHFLNPKTGLWGNLDTSKARELSRAVQGAYHFWLLYFYDRQPIPCWERAVDACLATQNVCGGFGQGVHTGSDRQSSACEDIDSIDPLARLLQLGPAYRRGDARAALRRACAEVLRAQTPDGGWWFVRGKPFRYGHDQLAASATEGAMFPTWFRTLSLAYLAQALPDSLAGGIDWQFCDSPGIQFWRP